MARRRPEPRRAVVVAVAGAVVLGFLGAGYEFLVPGETREVFGTVVGLHNWASRGRAGHVRNVAVSLDRGGTVYARYDGFVTVVPGDRVVLREILSPILGIPRFRFHHHVRRTAGSPDALVEGSAAPDLPSR